MRSARLVAVAVLAVIATALPIQSAFASVSLIVTPTTVALGGLITFSGTQSPYPDTVWVFIYGDSACAGTIVYGDGRRSQATYEITVSVDPAWFGIGQYYAQAENDFGNVKSSCVMFTVVAGIQATIHMNKVTTNGDTTTMFDFIVFRDGTKEFDNSVKMGDVWDMEFRYAPPIEITVQENVPDGWYISDISCEAGLQQTTFELSGEKGVAIITFQTTDTVTCTFTNSPVVAVGGVVVPANTLALVAPWLAVIGLVGCISTAVVVAKKRH